MTFPEASRKEATFMALLLCLSTLTPRVFRLLSARNAWIGSGVPPTLFLMSDTRE